ncbi:16715_t:CDS:2 [Funneliformis geosporum]|nr:16715_t:CDS:2 [Funneliformis geosporum]
MQKIAPNLSALIGEVVAARLIAHAGSLTNLSKYPASTVQILGAEKLFLDKPTSKYGIALKNQVEERLGFYEHGTAVSKNMEVINKVIKELKEEVEEESTRKRKTSPGLPITPSKKHKNSKSNESSEPDKETDISKSPIKKKKKKVGIEKNDDMTPKSGKKSEEETPFKGTPDSRTPIKGSLEIRRKKKEKKGSESPTQVTDKKKEKKSKESPKKNKHSIDVESPNN